MVCFSVLIFSFLPGLSEFVGSVSQPRTDVWKNSKGQHDISLNVYF